MDKSPANWGILERALLRVDLDLSDEESVERFVRDIQRGRSILLEIEKRDARKKTNQTMIIAGATASIASILGATVSGLLPKISDVMTKMSKWFLQ